MTIKAPIKHGNFQQLERNLPNLKVIVRDGKSGLDLLISWHINMPKIIITQTLLQWTLTFLMIHLKPKIMSLLDEFPFVIGSRYSLGGKCEMSGLGFY